MITEIRIKNMKGQTVTQHLSGKNIIIGKNGSGKTTRIQALGLAMLGNVPGQAKTSAANFKFATGDEMAVGLKTDGFEFTRGFIKDEKFNSKTGERTVSVKENVSVSPGKGERTVTQKKERIIQEIGNFPVAMDFNEFLKLSDAKRRDFIYSLSPIESSSWDKEKLSAYLHEKMIPTDLQVNNADLYEITNEFISEALKEYADGLNNHEGLQSMLDWTAKELSYWRRKQSDSQGAVRQMSEMKNQLIETDRNIAEAKKELEELQASLIEVEKKISADTEKKRNIDERLERISAIKKEMDLVKGTELQTSTEDIDKEIASLTASIPLPISVEEKLGPINKQIAELHSQSFEQQQKVNHIREQVMNIQANVQTLDGTLRRVGEMAGMCVISPMISCPKDFTGFDSYIDGKKQQAAEALQKLNEEHAKEDALLLTLKNKANELESQKAALFTQAQKVQFHREEVAEKIKAKEAERQRIISLVERRNNKLHSLNEELDKLTNQKVEPIGDISLMTRQTEGTRARIEELKKQVEEKEKSKQTLILMNENVLQNNEAEYKASAAKSLQDFLGPKGVQGELVKEILEPIRLQIKENLKLMNFSQTPYFETESETGKELFEFGWVNEQGHRVNFDALSTGQQTVYLAAMMMTIIDRAQPKLKILAMDNLNHLDKHNFQLLVNGLNGLAHKVDNIILAGALEYSFEADGWDIDDLSAGGAESAIA
ncbi:hypothetical protein NCCP2222_19510 [Sporosarcina sp. NCCP-2222]|uniref:AAA family ATPase n=1 Tax=Sporosarcina sp. NCCP-2222 TaxID=2935073 RepID=UPI002088C8A6|nr:AAA family ATPase [Sporosarcina sp. NCCP-2222]GKV56004.1 hypothetical protein NCCP2222_19510 [Sporosarcina sp. NCCP-2222]